MVVTVFGLGFVGLTTALGLCELGHTVYGLDVNGERREMIAGGVLPFYEPHMPEALNRHLGKAFFVEEDAKKAVAASEIIYFCVGTPYGADGAADLTYLYQAIDETLAASGDGSYRVLVVKSTVPPSTCSERVAPFIERRGFVPGRDIGVANNPEFLREGHCWEDFTGCDRVVLGVSDERSAAMLTELYKNVTAPVFTVSLNTGEFIKYLSNTLLATLISFANEMSLAADAIGNIDVPAAFDILHLDKRWNGCNMTSYVYPGCGYGGYCLPKDTNAFAAQAREKGCEPAILSEVIRLNDAMPENMANRIARAVDKGDGIGILGLSFKPGSDDVRDTPAAKIIDCLIKKGFKHIGAYDPLANAEFAARYPEFAIEYEQSMEAVAKKCDVIVITTAWPEFSRIKDITEKPVIDCRYMLR